MFDVEAPGDSMPTAASSPHPAERRTVETFERCGGRMKVHQVAKTHAQVQSALFELGYSLRAPPSRAPPVSTAQLPLPFG